MPESSATLLETRTESPPQAEDDSSTMGKKPESQKWEQCIDALLGTLSSEFDADEAPPSRSTILSTLIFLQKSRRVAPFEPPTCIITDPRGGLIVERLTEPAVGHSQLFQYTFLNDGTADLTIYNDGIVEDIYQIEFPIYPNL